MKKTHKRILSLILAAILLTLSICQLSSCAKVEVNTDVEDSLRLSASEIAEVQDDPSDRVIKIYLVNNTIVWIANKYSPEEIKSDSTASSYLVESSDGQKLYKQKIIKKDQKPTIIVDDDPESLSVISWSELSDYVFTPSKVFGSDVIVYNTYCFYDEFAEYVQMWFIFYETDRGTYALYKDYQNIIYPAHTTEPDKTYLFSMDELYEVIGEYFELNLKNDGYGIGTLSTNLDIDRYDLEIYQRNQRILRFLPVGIAAGVGVGAAVAVGCILAVKKRKKKTNDVQPDVDK